MRGRRIQWLVMMACGLSVAWAHAQNLQPNHDFSDPDNPLRGWNYDYEWTGNRNYVGNAERLSVLPHEGGRRNVLQIMGLGDVGSKVESKLLPFEEGVTYRARVNLRGGPYRVYFAGYSWRRNVTPHDNPTLAELRPVYRSRAVAQTARNWQSIELEIPGIEPTELSLRHLRQVDFVTVYLWALRMTHVEEVRITRH